MSNVVVMRQMSTIGWEDVLQLFCAFKRAQGRADTTVEDYRKTVTWFFRGYPDAWSSPHEARKGTLDFMSRQTNPNTYNIRYAYLKHFWDWCIAEGFFDGDHPLKGLGKKKPTGRAVRIEPETLRALLDLPDRETWAGLRDYSLILVQLDSGIRPGEALQLYPHDVDLFAGEIRIPAEVAKTRTARMVPLAPQTIMVLRKLIAVHEQAWGAAVHLFCSSEGRRLAGHSWAHRMQFYSGKLGVHITPYMLRHSSALLYLKSGGDLVTLQRIMGHSNLNMTKRYLNIIDDDVKEAHALASPITNLMPARKRVRKIGADR